MNGIKQPSSCIDKMLLYRESLIYNIDVFIITFKLLEPVQIGRVLLLCIGNFIPVHEARKESRAVGGRVYNR